MCPLKKFLCHLSCLKRVALISDVVALKNSSRAVTCNFHDYRFGNACSSKIPYSCTAKVME
jgi:hypothetical protein